MSGMGIAPFNSIAVKGKTYSFVLSGLSDKQLSGSTVRGLFGNPPKRLSLI